MKFPNSIILRNLLRTNSPPTITSQPIADQNATIGSNVTFSVDANGTGLNYQWQKQDANGSWVNIGGATASSFTINSVQSIHAGTYRVAITNAGGDTTHSANSVLNVSQGDPLTQGLVAYYPFNGNANDESGNGRNGTVNGPSLTTDRNGSSNSAYSFSGNTITLSDADSKASEPRTISLWAQTTTWSSPQMGQLY